MTTKREGEAVAASEVVLPREPNYVVKALEQATGIPLQPGQDPRTYFDATFDKLDPTTAEAFFALVTDQEALPSNEGLPVRDNGIGDFDDPRPVPPLEAIEERLNNASPDITKEEVARLVAVVMTGFEQPPTQHKLLLAIMTELLFESHLEKQWHPQEAQGRPLKVGARTNLGPRVSLGGAFSRPAPGIQKAVIGPKPPFERG